MYQTNLTVSQMTHQDNRLTIVKTTLYSFIFVLGMFGNLLVIKATRQYLTLRRPTNILICNLCVCDMFIMVLGVPIFVLGDEKLMEYFGVHSCRIVYPLLTAVLSATVFTLVVIAIERYDVIVNAVHTKLTLSTNKAVRITIWLDVISLLFAIPLCFSHLKSNTRHCEREWTPLVNSIFLVILFLVQYVIPLLVMVVLYWLCWHKIRNKNSATIQISRTHRESFRRRCQSESQTIRPKYASAEDLPTEHYETFTTSSKNHLSGITRSSTVRRSFSADSVYDIQHEQEKRKSFTHSFFRKSMTVDNNLSSKDRPLSFHESRVSFIENSLKTKHSLLGQSRQSFMGSVQKIQQSLTSLIIGADGMDALTAFATKRVKQTLKTLRVFSFILMVFALCMLPHHIVHFMYLDEVPKEVEFFEMFIYINAAVNPWIYAGMNQSYRVAFAAMFRRQNRRHISNAVTCAIFPPGDGHSRILCCKKLFACLQRQDTIDEEAAGTLECLNERRDTVRSLDFGFHKNNGRHSTRLSSIGSRKDSKVSRKASTMSEHEHIPFLAPIIIVTDYDKEMAVQQALLQSENVTTGGDDETQRFSAILSFHDA